MSLTSLTSSDLSSSGFGTGLPSPIVNDPTHPGQVALQSLISVDQGFRNQLRSLRFQLRDSIQTETAENVAKKLDEQSRLVLRQMEVLSRRQLALPQILGASVNSAAAPAATASAVGALDERGCVFFDLEGIRLLCKEMQNAVKAKGLGHIKNKLDLIFDAIHMACMGKIKAIKNGTTEVGLTKSFLSSTDKGLVGFSVELKLTNPEAPIRLDASKFEDSWVKGIVRLLHPKYPHSEKFVQDLIRIKKSKSAESKEVSE